MKFSLVALFECELQAKVSLSAAVSYIWAIMVGSKAAGSCRKKSNYPRYFYFRGLVSHVARGVNLLNFYSRESFTVRMH